MNPTIKWTKQVISILCEDWQCDITVTNYGNLVASHSKWSNDNYFKCCAEWRILDTGITCLLLLANGNFPFMDKWKIYFLKRNPQPYFSVLSLGQPVAFGLFQIPWYLLQWRCYQKGLKLQPAGQCDWKLSVGNQNFEDSLHQATNLTFSVLVEFEIGKLCLFKQETYPLSCWSF